MAKLLFDCVAVGVGRHSQEFKETTETDWIEEVTRTAITHAHNLSMSGGSGKTTYRASFNLRDVEGIQVRW